MYNTGVIDALNLFGIRTASLQGRIAEGPSHLGAERLTKLIADIDKINPTFSEAESKFKPVKWGPRTSIENSSNQSVLTGMGPYLGV